MEIQDSSPEMDLTNPAQFEELVAKAKTTKADPVEEKPKDEPKTDVKETKEASSAPEPEEEVEPVDGEETEETPDKLKARIRGLQAELTRRKGNAEKVNELEVQLSRVQGQLEQLNRAPKSNETALEDAIKKLDDRALVSKQTDWDDELADARARYAQAEDRGDEKAMERHGSRINYAKKVLSAIRVESLERVERKQQTADAVKDEQAKVKTELDSMYSVLTESYPDFQDNTSELWKAGDAEYKAHPEIMKRLGAAGEIVAAAMAVLKNPNLVTQTTESSARREVVNKLEAGVKKALRSGASSPTTGRTVVPQVSTGEGLAKFNEMVDRIKGG